MKRYMNVVLLYAILAMIGGGVYQIQRIHCPDHALCRAYPLFPAGHGVFPSAASVGEEPVFHQSKNRAGAGRLSYRAEPDRRNVRGARGDPGAWAPPLLRDGCGNLWRGRNRTHSAGSQSGAYPITNQAQRVGICKMKYGEGPVPQTRYQPLVFYTCLSPTISRISS